jgi:serine/threonine protein kinase
MTMCANIAFGLLEINSRGVQHRDMKPKNILIQTCDDLDLLMLTDFGNSKYSLAT